MVAKGPFYVKILVTCCWVVLLELIYETVCFVIRFDVGWVLSQSNGYSPDSTFHYRCSALFANGYGEYSLYVQTGGLGFAMVYYIEACYRTTCGIDDKWDFNF
jgi:hypothetical protein